MKIILLMGVQGSGKDHYANEYIKNNPNERVVKMKFAQPLRDIVQIVLGIDLVDENFYEQWKSDPRNRQILIDLSAHLKKIYGQHVLVNNTIASLKELHQKDPDITVIFTDCRFPFEFWLIWEHFMNTEVVVDAIMCNYKSDRYKKIPDQATERWALHLLYHLGNVPHGFLITDLLVIKKHLSNVICYQ